MASLHERIAHGAGRILLMYKDTNAQAKPFEILIDLSTHFPAHMTAIQLKAYIQSLYVCARWFQTG